MTVATVLAGACALAQEKACDAATGVCTTAGVGAPTIPGGTPAPGGKIMWASSRAFTDAPPLDVQKWLGEKPETDGKFVIVEFWRTWCGACKRNTALMNALQKKHGGELVVVGITGEPEEKIKAYDGPKKEYAQAIDKPHEGGGKPLPTEGRAAGGGDAGPDVSTLADPDTGAYEAYFNVWGWPHVIILEPEHRTIIWEGFPGLKGYELTEAKVERILAIGRKK